MPWPQCGHPYGKEEMKIPWATYRLQLCPAFGFGETEKILDYLSDLGISDIYAAPILKPVKGCPHGYDVVDHSLINPELGGLEGFERLSQAAQRKGLGWIQDIVPNHMAYSSENKMLMDVFENGPLSSYAKYFDFQFDHPCENLKNKILAPFLGEFYGHCLEENQIQIIYNEKGFFVRYFDLMFPVRIDSYFSLLTYHLPSLAEQFTPDNENLFKFMEITQWLRMFSSVADPVERTRQIVLIKSWLWRLYKSDEGIKSYIDQHLDTINNKSPASPLMDDMDRLLGEQFFRLAFWKVGNEELNYRRFFTINSLICLRMENDETFEKTHRLILQLLAEGKLTGLRIDHFDGLYDPEKYLKDLKDRAGDPYIVVEKILDCHEELAAALNIQGTTGYDFMNFANGIFVDKKNERQITKGFIAFTGMSNSYEALVSAKKKLFIGNYMAGDIDNLAHLLKRLLNHNRHGRDLTMYGLKRALVEVMAQFPVYRTYINSFELTDMDRMDIKESFAAAKNKNPGAAYELDAMEKVFLLQFDPDVKFTDKQDWLHFIQRFQQFTGALMAKGAEDTTFYIYNRLLSLNEVGGNPAVFGISPKQFHEFNLRRAEMWPHTMNATSTHDTKRGEDSRCRINVLSEIPKAWHLMVKFWSKINHSQKSKLKSGYAPDHDDEYFIYQTLIGAFPFDKTDLPEFSKRLQAYVIKAIREARIHTAWVKPDEEYEKACVAFVQNILKDEPPNVFLTSFHPFAEKIARMGILNSLSQVLIKATSPGVPDFYQGSEFWDLSFVDPDNRRPVDYQKRAQILREIKSREKDDLALIDELWRSKEDARIKLFVTHRVLSLRKNFPQLFQKGSYLPLQVQGKLKDHVLAFARQDKDCFCLTIVPRLLCQQTEFLTQDVLWDDTKIIVPENFPSDWKDVFTQNEISSAEGWDVKRLLEHFPVGLFVSPGKEECAVGVERKFT